jgi:hypothetical protein
MNLERGALNVKSEKEIRPGNKEVSGCHSLTEFEALSPHGLPSRERMNEKNKHTLTRLGSLLPGNSLQDDNQQQWKWRRRMSETHLLLAHGADNGDQEILAIIKGGLDVLAKVTLGDLDIVLSGTIGVHEVKETVINVDLYLARTSE